MKTTVVYVRVTPDLKKQVEDWARKTDRTLSEVVRIAIVNLIANGEG
jgi:predicted transcriptional regulator